MKKAAFLIPVALAACVETTAPAMPPIGEAPAIRAEMGAVSSHAGFGAVVQRMEPVIERECRMRNPRTNCDFAILIDERPDQPPNAYQTLDRDGRPVIAFTRGLIRAARNDDELAFVLGHEAAHHIAGHIPRQQQTAMTGAIIFGVLTAVNGGDDTAIRTAQDIGGTLGARRYAKDYELEADALGTLLTWSAGYDPAVGAEFFARIPDPGNVFLGTHPPNAQRIETVRRTMAGLG